MEFNLISLVLIYFNEKHSTIHLNVDSFSDSSSFNANMSSFIITTLMVIDLLHLRRRERQNESEL